MGRDARVISSERLLISPSETARGREHDPVLLDGAAETGWGGPQAVDGLGRKAGERHRFRLDGLETAQIARRELALFRFRRKSVADPADADLRGFRAQRRLELAHAGQDRADEVLGPGPP